jgi:hypothetical protein
MKQSIKHYRDSTLEVSLRFLWRQWSAIGVAGHTDPTDPWIIDPEALLLFSTTIARHDARLFDEIFDWLHLHGELINLTRLKNIRKQWKLGDESVLAALADSLATQSAHARWKTLVSSCKTPHAPPESLFPSVQDIDWQQYDSKLDPHFQKFGWLRTPPELRGMSMAPQPHPRTNLLFKSRWVFGLQSRAEIIPWLLCHSSGHPAEIARQTAYSKRIVQQTLNELESSGHIIATRSQREKHFRIIHKQWGFLLEAEKQSPPEWIQWPPVFAALAALHHTLHQPGIENASELFQAVKLRSAMEDLPLGFTTASQNTGTDFLHTLLDDFNRLLG